MIILTFDLSLLKHAVSHHLIAEHLILLLLLFLFFDLQFKFGLIQNFLIKILFFFCLLFF